MGRTLPPALPFSEARRSGPTIVGITRWKARPTLRGRRRPAKVRRMVWAARALGSSSFWVCRMQRACARGSWRGAASLAVIATLGCGGASDATKNRTFYDWSLGDGSQQFERPYPRLDWPENASDRTFLGVSVLEDRVHFSRPRSWRLRNASNRPEEPYIHYISPNAYSFAIHQRRDPPEDPWREILARYEADVESVGAKIVGGWVPVATANGQGRAFTIERDVESAKHPLSSRSRELLVKSGEMVVLVQIVHQEPDLSAVDHELLRAVASIHLP